ncbi:right-handed parallel beta-helix repeat-containing protein [Microbacterium dauci]|uniref:Right-handed parallel beta-helix repeat-containing protein n=1 Tax=Microbacterium dauci TaxID=3048008 RepID=A0ABT6ZED0_9MICO|nr:right-handed parallel beta-helix repeat-containing protein [Microbacterium sp. LX3-4]MDJ1114515.1 right-handed parallel beta-helix repeat-containing protein [Microbacterium sp. LX3-4]
MRVHRWLSSVVLGVAALGASGCGAVSPTVPDACPADAAFVGPNAEDLQDALDAATPGDVLALGDGRYDGRFTITVSGSAAAPIVLCGSRDVVLDGGATDTGYALHLDGASHWRIAGITVTGAAKGIVLDAAVDVRLADLAVEGTGEEAVHFRSASVRSALVDSDISRTGLTTPEYGEGVYIGSASSNWCRYSDCAADASDANTISGNRISDTAAEAIDVKEGTSGGIIRDNELSISADAVVDSVVDVKGNSWILRDNGVQHAAGIGIQVQSVADGWGEANILRGNTVDVPADAYAIDVASGARGTVIGCDNVTSDGAPLRTTVGCED